MCLSYAPYGAPQHAAAAVIVGPCTRAAQFDSFFRPPVLQPSKTERAAATNNIVFCFHFKWSGARGPVISPQASVSLDVIPTVNIQIICYTYLLSVIPTTCNRPKYEQGPKLPLQLAIP
jgi:hypothetical protein